MTKEIIPSKWMFIATWLIELKAPKKVVNAAIEIDNALIGLGLGNNTEFWEDMYNYEIYTFKLIDLINCTDSCTACFFAYPHCKKCTFGSPGNCTPRSKYADQYFLIVYSWVKKYNNNELH